MESIVEQMHVFFEPRSVAVVGASRRIMKAGHVIFKNFVDNRRRGIFKENCTQLIPRKNYSGYTCYSSITEIDEEIELVVIVVPAEVVPQVMNESAAKA